MVFITMTNVIYQEAVQTMRGMTWIISVLMGLLSACASAPPPVKHHDLLVATPAQAPSSASSGVSIGMGNVSVPPYLLALPLVHRQGNRLLMSETNQWTHSLGETVPLTVKTGLAVRLPTAVFLSAPFDKAAFPVWRVFVRIDRLEAVDNHAVELDARWSIIDRHGKTVLTQKAALQAPIADGSALDADMTDVVTAHREVLSQLCARLAEDLGQLPAP